MKPWDHTQLHWENEKCECLDWSLICLKHNYLKYGSDSRLCKHVLTTVYWWATCIVAGNFHSCRNILTIKSLKVEVGCSLFFTPLGMQCIGQWVLLQLPVAQGFVLLTLPVWPLALPGGSELSSTVMVPHGPARMKGKQVGPVPGDVQSQCWRLLRM